MMMNRFGTMCLEEQAQEEPEVEAEEVAEEVKTRADMKKAKLTQKEIASLFVSAKGEAQKQEEEHKALVKETSARTKKKQAADKKSADKTQPSEDVRDKARWLDESDRRDAAANAEGKVISVQESSKGRKIRKITTFFTQLKDTVQTNHLDKRTSRATYQHIYMHASTIIADFATAQ